MNLKRYESLEYLLSIKLIRQDNIRAKNEKILDTLKQIEIKSIFYDFSYNTDFIV